jgi:hypothetical protein
MMDPMAIVDDFIRESTEHITVKNPATGEDVTFVGKRFKDAQDYVKVRKKQEGRQNTLDKSKTGIPVTILTAIVEKHPDSFKDAKALSDGRSEIYVTSQEEMQMATTLEMGMVDPELSWADAVIWIRTIFPLCSTIATELNKINTEIAVERAKND